MVFVKVSSEQIRYIKTDLLNGRNSFNLFYKNANKIKIIRRMKIKDEQLVFRRFFSLNF